MTEPFASAVAAVAPVLILIGSTELALLGRRVLDADREVRRRFELTAAIPWPETRQEAQEQRREWSEIWAGQSQMLKPRQKIGMVAMLLCWFFWAGSQVYAFMLALRWLGTPGLGPQVSEAKICVLALEFGLMWVAFVPAVHFFVAHSVVIRRNSHLERQIRARLELERLLFSEGTRPLGP